MIIIFLIVLILIFLYFLLKNKYAFIIQNVIKGNKINEDIIYDNTNIFLGKDGQYDFITFDTQFYFKVNVPKISDDNDKPDDSYYLNNGSMCREQISDSICFKRNSDIVSEALLVKGIPKKTNCIQSGCIPETFNDDYC
jgi:hypothetical protein